MSAEFLPQPDLFSKKNSAGVYLLVIHISEIIRFLSKIAIFSHSVYVTPRWNFLMAVVLKKLAYLVGRCSYQMVERV